jgi:hypothetical protein
MCTVPGTAVLNTLQYAERLIRCSFELWKYATVRVDDDKYRNV